MRPARAVRRADCRGATTTATFEFTKSPIYQLTNLPIRESVLCRLSLVGDCFLDGRDRIGGAHLDDLASNLQRLRLVGDRDAVDRRPPGLHARVFGCATAVAFAGMPLGSLLAGVAVQSTSFQTAVLPAAALYLAITLIPVLGRRQWRQMNASADQGSPEPEDERP